MGGRTRWAPGAAALLALLVAGAAAQAQELTGTAAQASPLSTAVAAPEQAAAPGAADASAATLSQRFAPVGSLAPAQLGQSRMRNYVHDLIGPGALIGIVGGAALLQIENSPSQWGKGLSGYGDRVASNAGQLFVQESVHHGMAAAMDETTQYERCGCTNFSAQVSHAFVGAVTARDANGRQVVSVPRIAGAFAGSFATMLWWPGRTVGGAAAGGALSLVGTGLGNLVNELLHSPTVATAAR